ncbi:MAG: hypothetical protein WBM41_15200, partial [Arenicellales bacterium]
KEVGFNRSEIIKDESLYFSGTSSMLDLLETLDDRYQKVMIVGHNPAMTSLLNILCDSPIHNMPTSAIAVISFDMELWSGLSMEGGELLGYDFPKNSGGFTV